MRLTFSVPGPPVAWSRTYVGDDGKRHNNKKLTGYKKTVRLAALTQLHYWRHANPGKSWPTDGIYRLHLDVYCKSQKRGDASNYLKGVEDALEGVLYDNDRQLAVVCSRVFVDQPEVRLEATCSVIEPIDERYADFAGKKGRRKGGEPYARAGRG